MSSIGSPSPAPAPLQPDEPTPAPAAAPAPAAPAPAPAAVPVDAPRDRMAVMASLGHVVAQPTADARAAALAGPEGKPLLDAAKDALASATLRAATDAAKRAPPTPTGPPKTAFTEAVRIVSAENTGRTPRRVLNLAGTRETTPREFASFGVVPEIVPPTICSDHGCLDDGKGNIDPGKRQAPTLKDRLAEVAWEAKAAAASVVRPDLEDAVGAYRHFLHGEGAPRKLEYERFLATDPAGAKVLASALEDAEFSAKDAYRKLLAERPELAGQPQAFKLQAAPLIVGQLVRYPYPATENWQKAVGAHVLWMSAEVGVRPGPGGAAFDVRLSLHAFDRYNFNPRGTDVTSHTPDPVNGRFEVTGLGHEYDSSATIERRLTFTEGAAPP